MLTRELGIRLVLLAGKTVPVPAPPFVTSAVRRVEITLSDGGTPDGLALTLAIRREGPLHFPMLQSGIFDTNNRISIGVALGVTPEPLFNGVITMHQMRLGDDGQSLLTINATDLRVLMDTKDTTRDFPNMSDSAIVSQLLLQHAKHAIVPPHRVAPTMQVRTDVNETVWQQKTDLSFIESLAEANGFVFYLEPLTFGVSSAYWGPRLKIGVPQHALTMNMGPWTNVRGFNASEDARAPLAVEGHVLDPISKSPMPVPPLPRPAVPLAAKPTPPGKTIVARDFGSMNTADAAQRALAQSMKAEDSVSASAEVDTARYGHVLRPRRLVGVRGAGWSDDGLYYVKSVTHLIEGTQYTQRVGLSREGRGSLTPVVLP
jgi:hypothetical protein